MTQKRDHGGGLDDAIARFGGKRADWLDLSTGINPLPYPIPQLSPDAWTALPDSGAFARLEARARIFWNIPKEAAVIATPGASAAIAQLPRIMPKGVQAKVAIPGPTYNEHAAAFASDGWTVIDDLTTSADAMVIVHPNNPDGRIWTKADLIRPITIIDESFCDVDPDQSLIKYASHPDTVVLKSFGKFWGLAGLRLGFAIGDPAVIAKLSETLGPWQISGPALDIGSEALGDYPWAEDTRARLTTDAARLDAIMEAQGTVPLGGTSLFRLFEVANAAAAQSHLANSKIWSRVFPYNDRWLRLGLPAPDRWAQLEAAF